MTSTEQTIGRTIERAPGASGRLDDEALDQLFREARSVSYWQDRPVEESVIRELYDLLKMGPTSANTSPARFVFVRSEEAKARLVPLMPEMNQEKTRRAPLVVMIAYDLRFYEKLGTLMPYRDIKPWFTENPAFFGTDRASERNSAGGLPDNGGSVPRPGLRPHARRQREDRGGVLPGARLEAELRVRRRLWREGKALSTTAETGFQRSSASLVEREAQT